MSSVGVRREPGDPLGKNPDRSSQHRLEQLLLRLLLLCFYHVAIQAVRNLVSFMDHQLQDDDENEKDFSSSCFKAPNYVDVGSFREIEQPRGLCLCAPAR